MTYCLRGDVIYGSKDDWASQHYAIPEYFRTLFYSTHNFFPSYAPNIGAGENIYSLSYYGLYSPIIILSYFLPFVPMSYYIIATSVLSAFFSEGLLYYLFRRKYSTSITAFVTLLFAVSTPFIVNTHRQIMFIGYMPFNEPKYTFVVISPNISSNMHQNNYKVPINRYIINDLTKILFENT